MKRCPECRRDYYDEKLFYCLDDGSALLDGPISISDAETAILESTDAAATIPRTHLTETTPGKSAQKSWWKGLTSPHNMGIAAGIAIVVVILSFFLKPYFIGTNSKPITSVAVLPFQNGNANDLEYLSYGLSENLIDRLSRISGLKVIASSSSSKYKGGDVDISSVGKDLGVEVIVTGRLVQQGSLNNPHSIETTAIILTSAKTHLWLLNLPFDSANEFCHGIFGISDKIKIL